MGNSHSINKINFEDMQMAVCNKIIIINTLDISKQKCLISNTISSCSEENIINNFLKKDINVKIIIFFKIYMVMIYFQQQKEN